MNDPKKKTARCIKSMIFSFVFYLYHIVRKSTWERERINYNLFQSMFGKSPKVKF